MSAIAIFFHCVFVKDALGLPYPNALPVVMEQMAKLDTSGLLEAASEFHVGINGGQESLNMARVLFDPKARLTFHGPQCHTELRTLLMLEEWLPRHPDWLVLWWHSKGATKPLHDGFSEIWRRCMERTVIHNWGQCVADLEGDYDVVGCHYMSFPKTPEGQRILAGNFYWSRASYLLTLPSVLKRERIKISGLDSADSRYEAETWVGNGPRAPRVKDYHANWDPSRIGTCVP